MYREAGLLIASFMVGAGFSLVAPASSEADFQFLRTLYQPSNSGVQAASGNTFNGVRRVQDDVFSMMAPNIYEDFRAAGRVYHIRTNSKGLREEPFDAEPPENVIRVMFVGDSFTFGWGVDEDKRYVDLVEQRLNAKLEGRYQTIAAAIPGWGMTDYRRYFFHRGSRYKPDIVVVAFNLDDVISRKEELEIHRDVKEAMKENVSTRTIVEKVGEIKKRRIQEADLEGSGFLDEMGNITEVARRDDSEVLFYAYSPFPPGKKRAIKSWSSEKNVTFVSSPKEFKRLHYSRYSLSRQDRHYNGRGHRILADKIYKELKSNS